MRLEHFVNYLLSHDNVTGLIINDVFRKSSLLFNNLTRDIPIDNINKIVRRNCIYTICLKNGSQLIAIPYGQLCGIRGDFILTRSENDFNKKDIDCKLMPLLVYNGKPKFNPFIYFIDEGKIYPVTGKE